MCSALHLSMPHSPKGSSFPYPLLGISQLPVGLGSSSCGSISITYLQRGGHGLAIVDSRADTQAPRDADGVGRHREALQHHGVPPVTTVLPGKATNLQHQRTGGVRAKVRPDLGLQKVSPVLDS